MHEIHRVRRWPSPSLILLTLVAVVALSGCDDSFSPIEPSDVLFSIFGYLDVSADTQWIRVMPVRPLAVTEPEPSDAAVTLEHLGTGETIALRDSRFRFEPPNSEIGSEGIFLHNFWTTEPMEPGATYRFTARREGEEPSEAMITLPPEYDVEVWLGQPRTSQRNLLRLAGLPHVGLVMLDVHFFDGCGDLVGRFSLRPPGTEGNEHFVPIDAGSVYRGCGSPQIEKQEFFIVGSRAEWPSGSEYSAGGLSVPDAPSNISNSIGFLGGVLTRRVPYESCLIQGPAPAPEHCKLRYDEDSASIEGQVVDVLCETGPVAAALVTLTELDADAAVFRKVRLTSTRRTGVFENSALDAATR